MTSKEYLDYQARVNAFCEREGITHLICKAEDRVPLQKQLRNCLS